MRKRSKKDYAFYRGDELVCWGTKEQIAEFTGLSMSSIDFYSTPSHKKRVETGRYRSIVIEIEDEGDEYEDY